MDSGWEPLITPDKSDYLVERIQVDGFNEGRFSDDRRDQGINPVGFHINGECPSCKHDTTALCAAKYIAPDGDLVVEASALKATYDEEHRYNVVSLVTVLRCACVTSHANVPAATFGCGTEWLLRVSYIPGDAESTPKYVPVLHNESFKYWSPADSIATAVSSSLNTAQGSAKNWQAFLTGFLAIVGFASVIGGRDTIQELGRGGQIIFGVAAALALILDAAVLYYANLAQFGYPKVEEVSKPRYLRDSDLQPLKDASTSTQQLQRSFRLALGSVVAALIAIGVFLFWSPSATITQYKLTVLLSGTQATPTSTLTTGCGSIAYGTDAAGDPTVTLNVSDSGAPPNQDATTNGKAKSAKAGPAGVTYDMKNIVSIDGC